MRVNIIQLLNFVKNHELILNKNITEENMSKKELAKSSGLGINVVRPMLILLYVFVVRH